MGAEVLGSWPILGSRPPLGVDGALVLPNLGIGQGASCGGLGASVRGVRAPKRREKSPRLRLRSACSWASRSAFSVDREAIAVASALFSSSNFFRTSVSPSCSARNSSSSRCSRAAVACASSRERCNRICRPSYVSSSVSDTDSRVRKTSPTMGRTSEVRSLRSPVALLGPAACLWYVSSTWCSSFGSASPCFAPSPGPVRPYCASWSESVPTTRKHSASDLAVSSWNCVCDSVSISASIPASYSAESPTAMALNVARAVALSSWLSLTHSSGETGGSLLAAPAAPSR
mmetsp:Transcript_5842/g.12768  ORF Transcript_5842/g.12768 Transcript_5842/m.12768 type:complete len:288 (-) Transcript_5842:40-903(-)